MKNDNKEEWERFNYYFKIFMEEKLRGEEIRKKITGRNKSKK